MYIVSLFTTAKIWKQPKSPWTKKWTKKMKPKHAMKYYSALKSRKFAICGNMHNP